MEGVAFAAKTYACFAAITMIACAARKYREDPILRYETSMNIVVVRAYDNIGVSFLAGMAWPAFLLYLHKQS